MGKEKCSCRQLTQQDINNIIDITVYRLDKRWDPPHTSNPREVAIVNAIRTALIHICSK